MTPVQDQAVAHATVAELGAKLGVAFTAAYRELPEEAPPEVRWQVALELVRIVAQSIATPAPVAVPQPNGRR
jgi:hypothetical protein